MCLTVRKSFHMLYRVGESGAWPETKVYFQKITVAKLIIRVGISLKYTEIQTNYLST